VEETSQLPVRVKSILFRQEKNGVKQVLNHFLHGLIDNKIIDKDVVSVK
jgi:hypothetical protein